jgi:outer membrane immunogenic protein
MRGSVHRPAGHNWGIPMRSLTVLAATAALAIASAASAADMPRPAVQYHYTTPNRYVQQNWTGFYAGVNGGYAFGKAYGGDLSWSADGFAIGGTLGYNYQLDNRLVLGLEADADWLSAKGSPAAGIDSKLSSLYTVRGRVGYALGNWMPYMTGGFAAGQGTLSATGLGSDTHLLTGYAAGGGLEYAFNQSWSAKIEGLYVDLGKKTFVLDGIANDGGYRAGIVRAGLNYRF